MAGYLRDQLGTLLRLSSSTLQYVVCGVKTCKKAWTWAHGFSDATSNRVHAEYNRWWQQANPKLDKDAKGTSSLGLPQMTADYWIYEWLVLATHNPPNGNKASVPKLGASVLYPQYTTWCQTANEYPIKVDNFRSRLSVIKRDLDLVTRQSKKGSAECDVCSLLKRAAAKVTSLTLQGKIRQLLAKHIAFTNAECNVYFQHAFEAKDQPTQVMSTMYPHTTATEYQSCS